MKNSSVYWRSVLNSRERLLITLNHQEPDRVPIDLASTQVTAISRIAYKNLRNYLGLPETEPEIPDRIELTSHGASGYTLVMNLVEAIPLTQ